MAKKPEKPKVSKRVKINFDTINKGKIVKINSVIPEGFKKVDSSKIYEQRKKELEQEVKESEERYKRETEEEKVSIEKLKCPCCKSIKKTPFTIAHRDGPLICGGRNSVQKLADYNVCQNCGVMYVDLNKKEIAYPMSMRDSFKFFM